MKKWTLFAFTCMTLNGAVLICQKYVTFLNFDSFIGIYLGISYFIGFAACIAAIWFKRHTFSKKAFIYGLSAGLLSYVGSYVYIELMGVFPTALVIPLVSIGSIISITIGSVLIFKEKIRKRMIAAILTGILAVAFLCI